MLLTISNALRTCLTFTTLNQGTPDWFVTKDGPLGEIAHLGDSRGVMRSLMSSVRRSDQGRSAISDGPA